MRMLVTAAPGIEESSVRRTGFERLDDEPRTELGDVLFGKSWTLCNKHW
jgi:hypothetical protein